MSLCRSFAESERFQVRRKLRFQLRSVDEHKDRRMLQCPVFDEQLRGRDHRVGLPGPLGVPDQPAALDRVFGTFDHAIRRLHLMRTQHELV
jgi:hypothetical protein